MTPEDLQTRLQALVVLTAVDPHESAAIMATFKNDLARCDPEFLCQLTLLLAEIKRRVHQMSGLTTDNEALIDLLISLGSGLDGLLQAAEEILERTAPN